MHLLHKPHEQDVRPRRDPLRVKTFFCIGSRVVVWGGDLVEELLQGIEYVRWQNGHGVRLEGFQLAAAAGLLRQHVVAVVSSPRRGHTIRVAETKDARY